VWGNGFTSVTLRPLIDSASHFYERADQSIYSIEILGASRNGKKVAIELDNFDLDVEEGRSNKNLFVASEYLVKSGTPPYNNLTQHVGMEVAGPLEQKIMAITGRDHILALYRDPIRRAIDELYNFMKPDLQDDWPRKGVELVHEDNGVAILAHVFGPHAPPDVLPGDIVSYLVERVAVNNAWDADGIEIGYKIRGAPLETYLSLWDRLSANRVYITGVGVSDHHNVKDWDLRTNRMATWIQAASDDSASLADAIQSGNAFFGDPYLLDSVSGDLDFTINGTSVTMGDVVPVNSGDSPRFKVRVNGANSGDALVWLHNGEIVDLHLLSSSNKTAFKQLTVNSGDWVRVEMRTAEDEIYLMSNPIYFVARGDFIPDHRSM
jgi:hypothetical protein